MVEPRNGGMYIMRGDMRYPISGEPSDKLKPFDWHNR